MLTKQIIKQYEEWAVTIKGNTIKLIKDGVQYLEVMIMMRMDEYL